jgi:hypothetical protein
MVVAARRTTTPHRADRLVAEAQAANGVNDGDQRQKSPASRRAFC